MDEHEYPIIVEGDWRPEHAKSVKNKLHIYFQSKKKSQGGDCVVQFDQSTIATVLFKSSDIRDDVLSKAEHVITIDNDKVKLKVSKPNDVEEQPDSITQQTLQASGYQEPIEQGAPQTETDEKNPEESSAVVLENVPHDLSKDVLALLVENVSNLSDKDFTIELIPELNKAVVTFNNPSAVRRFVEESKTHRKFQKNNLSAHELERSTCVRVENLPDDANKMLLDLYFEKWGGLVEDIIIIPSEQAAIITFKEEEAKEKVLKNVKDINNVPVKIYPYFKSLGTALYGSNRPAWKLPESITVSVHPAIREFLLKKELISSISDQMSSQFCHINMDKAEVLISPDPALLKQKGVTREHLDGWGENASGAFKNMTSKYAAFEWPMFFDLWSKVQSNIEAEVKDLLFIDMDASKGSLTLAGVDHDLNGLKPTIDEILQTATSQIKREKNSVTEDIEMFPAIYSLLLQDGLQNRATTVSPQLHLDYKKDLNRLVLSGLPEEILTIKYWVLEKKSKMNQKPLKIDRSVMEFLRSVDCDEMSTDLFLSHGINAVYSVEKGDLVLIGSTEKELNDAERRLKMILTSNSLTVEDQDVLAMPKWVDLNSELQNVYNTPKKRTVLINVSTHKVTVSGFSEPVIEISENLGDFIEKHTRIEETVRVQSHAVVKFIKERKSEHWKQVTKYDEVGVYFDSKKPWIKLSGQRIFVQSAMSFFKKMAEGLHADTLTIKKAGAKKYFKEQGSFMLSMILKEHGFVVVLQEDDMLGEEEGEFSKGIVEDFGQVCCEFRTPGGVSVTVREADICKLKVDAVVNAANEDLKHIGGVAAALLQAAGPYLQKCCDQYTAKNGPLRPGEAIITEAGQLPCKYVIHAVGPRFSDSDMPTAVKRLRRAVRESLNQAAKNNCSSIAVPAVSSGIFGFPLELCAETIAKEVRAYIEDENSSSMNNLTEIHLVDNNSRTVKAMAQAVKQEFADLSPKVTLPHYTKPQGHSNREHAHRGQGGRGQKYNGQKDQGERGQGFGPGNIKLKGRGNSERPAYMRTEIPDFFSGGRSEKFDGLEVLDKKTTQEGLQIILSKGNIQDACANIIVNTISEDLDLSKGAVSRALLQAAGHQIQSEITNAANSDVVNYGEVVITNGNNLKCAKVFHVVCPFWNGGQSSEVEVLVQIIRDCLKIAENRGMDSIAFPAIGTGNLGFPKELVARIMLTEVQAFSVKIIPQNLREVTVIVHPSDKECVECFTSIFRYGIRGPISKGPRRIGMPKVNVPGKSSQSSEFLGTVSTPSLGVHTMQVGHVTLEVSSGDITKEKTDAIVNSSNQSFSLKAGVSKAILDAAGLQVEEECLQIVRASNVQQTEIVTSAGKLPCRIIIHIVGGRTSADIKDAVLSVLKLCEAQQLTSVAFPALGTGAGRANPADVADTMIDAVIDFVKKKKPVHLKCVKFLIFQTSMVVDFHQSMLRRASEGVEDKGFLDKIIDFAKELFGVDSSDSPTNEEWVMVSEEIEPAVFQLCGETPEDLSKAREIISNLIIQEHTNIPLRDPSIAHFTKEDVEMLSAMQRELTVSIKHEKRGQDSVITLEGLTRDVHTAESRIRDVIRKVERNENRRREAFLLSSVVEWQYLESGHNHKTFDMLTNYKLEEAFNYSKTSVKIKINNKEYDADLVRRVATDGRNLIELKRVDLRAQHLVSLPSHWDDMKGQSVVLIKLQGISQEYADVVAKLTRARLNFNIIQIERVQNRTLWSNYTIQKKHLEDKNKHKNNEKCLFHGTGADKIDQINHHGFNRSYAGMHAAMYGNGTYFAVDPKYSAQGYSKPDANGYKRMYLARVLVGDFTQGRSGMVVPPVKSKSSVDLYDSVTDNPNSPSMFVIFHDVQAYPEYLITFQ